MMHPTSERAGGGPESVSNVGPQGFKAHGPFCSNVKGAKNDNVLRHDGCKRLVAAVFRDSAP